MSKFHVNKKGVPAPCKAQKGNCPLGGEESHFDTQEEAQAAADKANEQEHGIIAGINESHDENSTLKTADGIELREGDNVFRYADDDDEDAIFGSESEARDYIDYIYYGTDVDRELTQKGLEKVEITKEMIDRYQKEEAIKVKNRTHGTYQGNEYRTSAETKSALLMQLNKNNVKRVFDDGFQNGDIPLNYKTESFNNTPVELDVKISKTGNDEYEVKGEIHEYSMSEDDFDSQEEFNDYVRGEPDMSYDVDYKFTSDELKNNLIESERLGDNGIRYNETQGALFAGVYDMSRDNMK